MATTTSSALSRLRRKLRDSQAAYQKSTAASLNQYGKVVQKSFQQGLVSRANLVAKREERENKQRSLRERFTAATSNVLSRETLAMLHEHSKIAAPTLTSIFTGYESARADRADRFEKLLDKREEGMERIQAADELAFRDAATQRQQALTAQGNILNNGLATQKALFASDADGIATEARFANTDIEIAARQEEARRARQAALELQQHKDKIASGRDAANNKQALDRLQKQIDAKIEAARIAAEKAEALAKQKAEADKARQEQADAKALSRLQQSDADARARDAARVKAEQEAAKTKREFESTQAKTEREAEIEAAKQEQAGAIAQIKARTAGEVEVKTTLGAGTTSTPKPHSYSTLNFLRSNNSAVTKPTPAPSDGSSAGEIEVVNEDPVVPGGTESVGQTKTVKSLDANGNTVTEEISNFGERLPNAAVEPVEKKPDIIPEPNTLPVAPVDPTAATYFDTNIANSEDPEGEARQLISSVLAERGVVALNDLGDDATFEQLASLIDEENEEDERLTSVIAGIRQNRTTEVS